MKTYKIPPLISGGLMLSYRCTSNCRHCLYRCSPYRPDEWMTLEMAEQIFHALGRERYLEGIHIAGGEPTMKWTLLLDIIRLAVSMKIPIEYLETNASWCNSREGTRKKMNELKEAGLSSMLVSVSMFHNEFIPFSSTRNCIEIARTIFGDDHVIPYLPHMYHLIAEMPGDGKHSLEDFCIHHGVKPSSSSMVKLYDVVPSGRAVTALRSCYQSRAPSAFKDETCEADLMSPTHFHIDHQGNLFTGCCAGIVSATPPDLHPEITPDTHPIFHALCTGGPVELMETIGKEAGIKQRAGGYVSKCDLCIHIREQLAGLHKFSELRPIYFYRE